MFCLLKKGKECENSFLNSDSDWFLPSYDNHHGYKGADWLRKGRGRRKRELQALMLLREQGTGCSFIQPEIARGL
jgi:hypothetical protein